MSSENFNRVPSNLFRNLCGWFKIYDIGNNGPSINLCLFVGDTAPEKASPHLYSQWTEPDPFVGDATNSHLSCALHFQAQARIPPL